MRLINTATLKIEDFPGRKIPRYAILSHTWAEGELTFQDWIYTQGQDPPRWGWSRTPDEIDAVKSARGYVKVVGACEYARTRKACQWLWADTVCIDKTSSAELSEAINSMFEWYRQAEVCLAFLADVPALSDDEMARCSRRRSPFRESRWFRRGWTLQELVAPWTVEFLSVEWTLLGTKKTLASHLSTITSIPQNCLSGNWSRIRGLASTAQKMSWAARRETSRVEDRAYCLLGLFGINMPLLYGEGEKAFRRLQEEIIKQTDDLTFLAWRTDRTHSFEQNHFVHWKLPPLADNPDQFSVSRDVVPQKGVQDLSVKRIFMANTGLFIHRPRLSTLDRRFQFVDLGSEVSRQPLIPGKAVWMPVVCAPPYVGFFRTSFPASTVVTTLDASRSQWYTGNPVETCIQQLIEPSPQRHYLRKLPGDHDWLSPRRQVGIIPVFSPGVSWIKLVDGYPAMPKTRESPIFHLANYGQYDHVHHGILIFQVSFGEHQEDPGSHFWNRFGVHVMAVFNPETNTPLHWDTIMISGYPSPGETLGAAADSLTKTIVERGPPSADPALAAAFRPASRPATHQFRAPTAALDFDARSATRLLDIPWISNKKDDGIDAFADMDMGWHKFRSGSTAGGRFDTFINLVLIGERKPDGEARRT